MMVKSSTRMLRRWRRGGRRWWSSCAASAEGLVWTTHSPCCWYLCYKRRFMFIFFAASLFIRMCVHGSLVDRGGKRFGHAVACQGPGEPVLLSIPGFSLSEPKMACTVRSCHSPMVLPMVGKIHVNWSKETLVWIELWWCLDEKLLQFRPFLWRNPSNSIGVLGIQGPSNHGSDDPQKVIGTL